MAATVKVREVFRRASVILNDVNPQFVRVPERDMVDFLNDGQLALAKYAPWTSSAVLTVKLKAGTRQSIESIAAADVKFFDGTSPSVPIKGTQFLEGHRNMGTDGATPGRSLRVVRREDVESLNPDWHTATAGEPTLLMFDPRFPLEFWNYPPAPAGRWVDIGLNYQPTKIVYPGTTTFGQDGADATVISVRDENVDDLVNYIVARAHLMDTAWAEEAKAVGFTNLFVSSLNAIVLAHTGNSPNLRQLPFAPSPPGQAK